MMLKNSLTVIAILIGAEVFSPALSSPSSENVTKILNDLMKKPYDKRVRPLLGENALFIRVSFRLDSLTSVSEQNSEISVRMILKQTWLEPRLTFTSGVVPNDTIELVPEHARLLWRPDTAIGNQRKLEKIEGQEYTVLNSEGLVTTSTKMLLTVDCPMNYEHFPFDSQTCTITFSSHMRDRRDLIYEWMTEESMIDGTLRSGRFQVVSYDTNTSIATSKQASVTLTLCLHLRASWKEYLSSVFLPLVLFTGISLTTLWILSAKIGILVNLLNIAFINIFLVTVTKDGVVRVNHTGIGQYLTLSFFFVFAALTAEALELYLESHTTEKQSIGNETGRASPASAGPKNASSDEDLEKGIELEENPSKPNIEEADAPTSISSSRNYRLYFQKARSGLEGFSKHAYWILTLGFIILNMFYFGIQINSQDSRMDHADAHKNSGFHIPN